MKSFYVHVIGCQQNEHDGARIKYLFEKIGLIEAKPEQADIIVVVACSVRQTAVDRIFGNVRNWLKNHKGKKIPLILATGCVLESDKKKFAARNIKFWDIEKPEDLSAILKLDNKKVSRLLEEGKNFTNSVPIMFGCNNFCTYCATAFTRGRERSRKMSTIISDVENLIKKGHKEILLLGQTIDSYRDPETGATLDMLFKKLNELEGDFIISFTSNHPKDMTVAIIEAVASLEKIKKEIHLPIQSGSDKVLQAMRRPYTAGQYLDIVKKIQQVQKKYNVEIDITTDVIVGFPNETEDDFAKTVEIFKKVKYTTAYINKYSPRFGTAAYKLGDPIPWQEKQRRWRILNDLMNSTRSL